MPADGRWGLTRRLKGKISGNVASISPYVLVRYGRLSGTQRHFVLFCTDCTVPVAVAARSKALVCGRFPAEIVGSNPAGGMDVCVQ